MQAMVSVLLEEDYRQLRLLSGSGKKRQASPSNVSMSFIAALDLLHSGKFVPWRNLILPDETSFAYRTPGRGAGEHRLAKILRGELSPAANASYDIEVDPVTSRGKYPLDSEETLNALRSFTGRWEVKSVTSNLILMGTGTIKESTRICNDYVQICDQLIKYHGELKPLVALRKIFERLYTPKNAVTSLERYVADARGPARGTTIDTVEIDVLFSNAELRSKTLNGNQIDSIFKKSIMDILNPTDNDDAIRAAVLTHDAFFEDNWFNKHLESFKILDGYPGIAGFFLVDEEGVRMFKADVAKTKFKLDTITLGGRASLRVGSGNYGWRHQ